VNNEKALSRLSKGNIALAVIFEDLHIKTVSASQATGFNGGHVICVINTHILADPEFTDVKLWQAQMLLRTLEIMPIKSMPLLICGDFNSTPDSGVYELWRTGSVRSDNADLNHDPYGLISNLAIGHQLRLMSAYETCNGREAQYTNYTEDLKGTLDYIWFSPDTLSVLAISEVDIESQLAQETALPSSARPSDHISLVCTFMFNDAPQDRERQAVVHGSLTTNLRGMTQRSTSGGYSDGSMKSKLGGGTGGSTPFQVGGAGGGMLSPQHTHQQGGKGGEHSGGQQTLRGSHQGSFQFLQPKSGWWRRWLESVSPACRPLMKASLG